MTGRGTTARPDAGTSALRSAGRARWSPGPQRSAPCPSCGARQALAGVRCPCTFREIPIPADFRRRAGIPDQAERTAQAVARAKEKR